MIRFEDVVLSRIESLSGGGSILVALSGGGDSTALLLVLIEAFGPERLSVCIVDHALRAGSAKDAALAYERARAFGVEAEIRTLSWPDGPKLNQAAARDARYRALCAAARVQNCRVIALGHNADDQAETILMRSESGSTWRGLAGMREIAPAPIWPEGRGLWLVRPLLNSRRADLRNFLTKNNAEWIEDPANANPHFARVRMRARLAEMERDGFDPNWLCDDALAYQARAAKHDVAARAILDAGCNIEDGAAQLDRALWRAADASTRRRVLSVIIAAIAGAGREPGAEAIERLEAELLEEGFSGAALGGALIQPRRLGPRLTRDPGAVLGRADGAVALPPLELTPGAALIWDNRLRISAETPGWRVLPAQNAAPVFEKAGDRLTSSEAEASGEIRAEWLTRPHIDHLLPPEVWVKPAPFIPS